MSSVILALSYEAKLNLMILQAKKEDSQQKLQELTEQMEQLLADKKELEIKNRILAGDLELWQDHLEAMWGQQV